VSGEKTRLVPKLRFPEFRGAEWVQKKLEDVAPLQRGFDLPSDLIRPGNIPIVYSNGIQKYHEIGMATAPGLVTGRSGTIGKLHFIEHGEYWPHNTSLWVTDFKSHVPRFVYYLYASIGMGQFSSGSGVPTLNRNDVHAFSSAVPISLTEQQKIADCLTSLDELIAAQARKVEALKTHKKGLMQQLFPREGETQPRLRFPEFQNTGMWETRLLGDVVKSFKTGKLDANAMVENGQYRFYTCAKKHYQIDHYAFEGEALLVAGNGAHLGYIHHYIGKFNAYQRTYVLQQFKANVIFIRCLLDRYLPARILFEKKDGNTPYIVLSTLTDMPLVIPTDMKEQERIADCLTSLDSLITAAIYELETLKTHKKGLMQQLFPSAEAVEACAT